jgi:hypothetical protein
VTPEVLVPARPKSNPRTTARTPGDGPVAAWGRAEAVRGSGGTFESSPAEPPVFPIRLGRLGARSRA